MRVRTSRRAAESIRARGGIAYVWLEDRLRVSTDRPAELQFEEHLADGYRLFLDSTMATPPELEVSLRLTGGLRAKVPASTGWFWRAVSKGQDVSEFHGG